MSERHIRKQEQRKSGLSRIDGLDPLKTFIFLALLGSTLVFLSMVFLYSLRLNDFSQQRLIVFPKPFILSTVFLVISSLFMSKALQAYKDDSVKHLQLNLLATSVLAIVFAILQFAGWMQLVKGGLFTLSSPSVTFLYVITVFHLLHIGAGLVGLVYFNLKSINIKGDMVRALLYFSDKREKTKIELLAIFWHYINFLWFCLFCMFLYTL